MGVILNDGHDKRRGIFSIYFAIKKVIFELELGRRF